jgi:hypothetical protein
MYNAYGNYIFNLLHHGATIEMCDSLGRPVTSTVPEPDQQLTECLPPTDKPWSLRAPGNEAALAWYLTLCEVYEVTPEA